MNIVNNAALDQAILERESGAGILAGVEEFLGRFVAYPSEHARVAHVLWVAHTHMMQAWETTPRLAAMSEEKASGKSRLLEVTEMLVPSPILSISASPAYIVRRVSEGEATVLYDEIDALFGSVKLQETNVDVRSILNGGYRRGAKVHRCVVSGGRKVETEELDAFAPVAMAGLRDLPDTLASRSIFIRMKRRAPDEHVESFVRRRIASSAEAIKAALSAWCASVMDAASTAEPTMPDGIVDRSEECWTPLLIVADLAGGSWPERARRAAAYLVSGANDENRTAGVELLEHIREAFGDEDRLPTTTLLQRLHERDESPWKDIRGKPLDDRGLARRLKGYGIKSGTVRVGDRTPKGYVTGDFEDAWKRYCPSPDPSRNKRNIRHIFDNKNNNVADVAAVALSVPTGGPSPTSTCTHCGGAHSPEDPVLECHVGDQLAWLHRGCEWPWLGGVR